MVHKLPEGESGGFCWLESPPSFLHGCWCPTGAIGRDGDPGTSLLEESSSSVGAVVTLLLVESTTSKEVGRGNASRSVDDEVFRGCWSIESSLPAGGKYAALEVVERECRLVFFEGLPRRRFCGGEMVAAVGVVDMETPRCRGEEVTGVRVEVGNGCLRGDFGLLCRGERSGEARRLECVLIPSTVEVLMH